MKSVALIFCMIFAIPAHPADEILFEIDAEKILERSIVAAAEQYPGVSTQDLKLDRGVWVLCYSTRPNDQVSVFDEVFNPCVAGLALNLDPNPATFVYVDHEGNCKVRGDLMRLGSKLSAEGIITVSWMIEHDSKEEEKDCAEGTEIPPRTTAVNLDEVKFWVDARKILDIAVATVIQVDPQILPENLFLNGLIHINCLPEQVGRPVPGLYAKLAPCQAMVPFGIKSRPVEHPYLETEGVCKIRSGIENAKVYFLHDGSVRFEVPAGYYGTDDRVVECTEEFFESLNEGT